MFELPRTDATEQEWPIVQLVVRSNHGHTNFTCLYRFRVHGVDVDREHVGHATVVGLDDDAESESKEMDAATAGSESSA